MRGRLVRDNVFADHRPGRHRAALDELKLYRRHGPVHRKLCKAGSLLYGLCEVIPTNREPQSVLRHTGQGDPP